MRQPVSIDAIQEINIALADYDTTITGATGAVVNAVTRSGTNSFSGSVYGAYRDKDWVRDDDGDVYGQRPAAPSTPGAGPHGPGAGTTAEEASR